MNDFALLAERLHVDIDEVRRGVGGDPRIGSEFLAAGCGFGGSCLPKDLRALQRAAVDNGVLLPTLAAVEQTNERQKALLATRAIELFDGSLEGRRIALWGLAFKAGTDDLRDSPALTVAALLAAEGADLLGYDPGVPVAVPGMTDDLQVTDDPLKVASGAAVLVLLTDWPQFRLLDWGRLAELAERRIVVDTRNLLDADVLRRVGFEVRGIGRRPTPALTHS
jgi:UDPglucose 6-dehydrogenase